MQLLLPPVVGIIDKAAALALLKSLWVIKNSLIVCVRMDSGHKTFLDPELIMQYLANGAKQLVVHEALEMT